jgi:hypothetical protein
LTGVKINPKKNRKKVQKMFERLTQEQIMAVVERALRPGVTVGEALWMVAGPALLEPGEDATDQPATVTVTVRLRPRHAEFLRQISVDHRQLEKFMLEAISQARLAGQEMVRAAASKEPGDGQGVVMIPRSAMPSKG